MRQALHIFRKDVRFLWQPILLVLGLTMAFAWSQAEIQGPEADIGVWFDAPQVSGVAGFLLALCWLYLVAAAIYQEPPAGDRQFWVTRPYSWRSLVTARLLFIAAFINVPFLLSDLAILSVQGLPATASALCWRQVVLTGVFLIPAAALAAVTKHYAQIALSIFAGFLIFLLFAGYSNIFFNTWGHLEWIPASLVGTLLLLSSMGVLFWQYQSRRTWLGGGILTVAAGLCLGTMVSRPFDLALALTSSASGPAELRALHLYRPAREGFELAPDLVPIATDGLPSGEVAEVELSDLTIAGADGASWHWGWHPKRDDVFGKMPGIEGLDAGILVDAGADRRLVARLRSQPVNIRLSAVIMIYRVATQIYIPPDGGRYKIPGVGDCLITGAGELDRPWFNCRAVGYPAGKVVINHMTVPGEPPGYGALVNLSPIIRHADYPWDPSGARNDSITLTEAQPVARVRRDLVLKQVRLGARKR